MTAAGVLGAAARRTPTGRRLPTGPEVPAGARRLGLVAALAGGLVLGTGTGLVALARRDRAMHTVGRTYRATVEPVASAEASGALWVDTLGPREALVRFSRGVGLPPWAPDVQGIAVRLPERRSHTDLLFSSTGLRGPGRFVLVPRRSVLAGPASTLMPFRGPDGPLVLAVEPAEEDRTRTPTQAEGAVPADAPSPSGTRWRLLWSGVTGAWHPFAELVVGDDAGPLVERGTRFDPLGASPPGLPSYRWAAALRRPAYRLSQLLGRGRPRGG